MMMFTTGTLWQMTGNSLAITLIGAGGKTSTLQALVKEIDSKGSPVIATTTTKVFPMEENIKCTWKNLSEYPPMGIESPCFWYASTENHGDMSKVTETKWIGPSKEAVDQGIRVELGMKSEGLKSRVWVIEADGARGKNLKCWDNSYEPQIPQYTRCGVLVIRGDLWGKVLTEEDIHRDSICPSLVGQVWNAEQATGYLLESPIFDANYNKPSWIVLFNRHDLQMVNLVEEKLKEIEKLIYNLQNIFSRRTDQTNSQVATDSRDEAAKVLPKHLRIAIGNVKEGNVQWYDLW